MREHALKQVDLAEVLEVPLDRVKSLTSGKVKNLKREESELLIGKLGIRAQWLVTGEGPMHEDGESQDEFVGRMQAINRMTALIQTMPVREITRLRLCALMTGEPAHDGPLIARALMQEAQGVDFVTGHPSGGAAAPPPPPAVSEGDRILLDNFHSAPAQVQAGVKTTLGAFAPAAGARSPRRGKAA